ncbi:hypothetical protein EFM54_08560 [Lentilactobacillus buchneri]|nr:hypothetical protein [Lentilactobacillus buchneri]
MLQIVVVISHELLFGRLVYSRLNQSHRNRCHHGALSRQNHYPRSRLHRLG